MPYKDGMEPDGIMPTKNSITEETDRLLRLFRAFREGNGTSFRKVAESIISDQVVANRHSLAKELQKALGPASSESAGSGGNLTALPKRRGGDDLLTIIHEPASTDHLLLDKATRERIDRVVDERRNAKKLAQFGYTPKSRLLFWGPPGCGKTLTAHHLANQFNLKIGLVRLSSLVTSYLGETAAKLQTVFDVAQQTPMVLLFDEIDSVAKSRDDANDVGELKRVVNSLLQAMDSFVAKDSLLIGASNHQYLLDPAIWRRFDDVVMFPKPSLSLRTQFIRNHCNGVKLSGSVQALAKKMSGLTFADIELVLIESIKSMILEDRRELELSAVTKQLNYAHKMKSAMEREITSLDG